MATKQSFANYELHSHYLVPANAKDHSAILLNGKYSIPLPNPSAAKAGTWQSLKLTFKYLPGKRPQVSVWINGKQTFKKKVLSSSKSKTIATWAASRKQNAEKIEAKHNIAFHSLAGEKGPICIEAKTKGIRFANMWIRPLLDVDAAKEITRWSELSMERGKIIYNSLCITCHGDTEKEGSLPTALKFHEGALKNGSDPLSMYQTLTSGYGQMMQQAWMSGQQKLDVIHYIRETQISGHNPTQLFKITSKYLASLPGFVETGKKKSKEKPKRYLTMNYGDSLMLSLQLKADNIVQKGIVTRLDQGGRRCFQRQGLGYF